MPKTADLLAQKSFPYLIMLLMDFKAQFFYQLVLTLKRTFFYYSDMQLLPKTPVIKIISKII